MNETANATLALGALPVMAHAPEEVEEMVALAGALVLNIGTLSSHWVDAMLAAGRAANERRVPVVLDPVGVGATAYRTDTARRILEQVDVAVLRGNAGEVATLVGVSAEVRGVESIAAGAEPAELAREAARSLGVVASVTGAVDHVSDGERVAAIANGDPMLATITGTGCMSSAMTGCFLAVAESPFDAAVEALVAFGVAGEDAARDAKGPGSFHVNLYDALAALDPATLDDRASVVVRVHAIVEDVETARRAIEAGATVVQLRVKAPTDEVVARGRGLPRARHDLRRQRRRRRGARARGGRRPSRPGRPRRGGARARAACCSAARRPRSRRRSPRRPTTSASALSGRRRRRTTRPRRSGSRSSRASARAVTSRSWRSAGSTPRTPANASARVRPESPSSAPRPTRRCGGRWMRLSELGELGLLAELERRGLISGVENDAAQLGGGLVVTQDTLVEGVHFRLDWLSWRELGFRAAAVNLSDLAASGAEAGGADRQPRAARPERGRGGRRALRGNRRGRGARWSAATRPRADAS